MVAEPRKRKPGPPVLIFAPNKERAEAVARTMERTAVLSEDTVPLALRKALVDHANGELKVLVATPAMATGWRAPLGTIVLFEPDFPQDEALRAQARARVPTKETLHASSSAG